MAMHLRPVIPPMICPDVMNKADGRRYAFDAGNCAASNRAFGAIRLGCTGKKAINNICVILNARGSYQTHTAPHRAHSCFLCRDGNQPRRTLPHKKLTFCPTSRTGDAGAGPDLHALACTTPQCPVRRGLHTRGLTTRRAGPLRHTPFIEDPLIIYPTCSAYSRLFERPRMDALLANAQTHLAKPTRAVGSLLGACQESSQSHASLPRYTTMSSAH